MTPGSLERHYKTAELAELFSVDEETVRRAARHGELRSVRIGRGIERRYSESAVREWLELLTERSEGRSAA